MLACIIVTVPTGKIFHSALAIPQLGPTVATNYDAIENTEEAGCLDLGIRSLLHEHCPELVLKRKRGTALWVVVWGCTEDGCMGGRHFVSFCVGFTCHVTFVHT